MQWPPDSTLADRLCFVEAHAGAKEPRPHLVYWLSVRVCVGVCREQVGDVREEEQPVSSHQRRHLPMQGPGRQGGRGAIVRHIHLLGCHQAQVYRSHPAGGADKTFQSSCMLPQTSTTAYQAAACWHQLAQVQTKHLELGYWEDPSRGPQVSHPRWQSDKTGAADAARQQYISTLVSSTNVQVC